MRIIELEVAARIRDGAVARDSQAIDLIRRDARRRRLLHIQLAQRVDGAGDGGRQLARVDGGRDLGHDADEAAEQAAGALVADGLAEDAEQQGGGEGAVDRGPGAVGEGADVLQAEEGFDRVGEALDARLAEGNGELVLVVAGADGGPAELRHDVRDVEVEGPVLELLLEGLAHARVTEVVGGLVHHHPEFVLVPGDALHLLSGRLIGRRSISHDI